MSIDWINFTPWTSLGEKALFLLDLGDCGRARRRGNPVRLRLYQWSRRV